MTGAERAGGPGADLAGLVPESRRFNEQLERMLAEVPSVHTVAPEVTRRARREGRSIWPAPVRLDEGDDRSIEGRDGPIPLRIFVPPGQVAGVYLHLHGGGWTLGGADQQDVALWSMARHAGVAVVSVGYRLAPEHPFPAGPDDCEDAARWLLQHAEADLGTSTLVIGGESAGAHLSALTLLRLRDAGLPVERFVAANLVFGDFDLSMTPSQRRWGDRNLVLSGPIIEWFLDCFVPGRDPEERRHPSISPLYADLSGLPPALFTVGELDPLLDDSLFMAARWETAGAVAKVRRYPESVHGFTAFPLEMARAANEAQTAFVRAVVRRTAG